MATKNVVKGWKTTILGILILIASLTSVFLVAGINWFDASIGIAIGLSLLFSPDDVIKRIRSLIKRS